MKPLCKTLAVLFLCCLMAACNGIASGEVKSKRLSPAHEEESTIMVGDFPVRNVTRVPDRWYVTIGQKCEDGVYRTNEIRVSKETYDGYKIGDWANFRK